MCHLVHCTYLQHVHHSWRYSETVSVNRQALPFELESLLVSEVLVRAQTVTGVCPLGPDCLGLPLALPLFSREILGSSFHIPDPQSLYLKDGVVRNK